MLKLLRKITERKCPACGETLLTRNDLFSSKVCPHGHYKEVSPEGIRIEIKRTK